MEIVDIIRNVLKRKKIVSEIEEDFAGRPDKGKSFNIGLAKELLPFIRSGTMVICHSGNNQSGIRSGRPLIDAGSNVSEPMQIRHDREKACYPRMIGAGYR